MVERRSQIELARREAMEIIGRHLGELPEELQLRAIKQLVSGYFSVDRELSEGKMPRWVSMVKLIEDFMSAGFPSEFYEVLAAGTINALRALGEDPEELIALAQNEVCDKCQEASSCGVMSLLKQSLPTPAKIL